MIALVTPRDTGPWLSHHKILNGLAGAWLTALKSRRDEFRVVRHRGDTRSAWHDDLLKAHTVVYTIADQVAVKQFQSLRTLLNPAARAIFHVHGEFTRGGDAFTDLAPWLRSSDLFIVSCAAEARALKLVFKNAAVKIVPFPIALRARAAGRSEARCVSVGRVSEQKNVHVLISALWWLRKEYGLTPTLEIYGREDRLGNPNTGQKPGPYLATLRTLVRELELERQVHFRGFASQNRLAREVLARSHVFVSASVHADENFGMSVAESLASGHTAVLSAWGAHVDHAKRFAGRVRLVGVGRTKAGPAVDPKIFARALAAALTTARQGDRMKVRRASNPYSPKTIALLLAHALRARPRASRPLQLTALARAILRQRKRMKPRRFFKSAADPLAQPFFAAYGQSPAR